VLAAPFPTPIHKYAQAYRPISIDAQIYIHYLAHQIEPGSLELYGSVSRTQQLNGGCGREVEPRREKFCGFSLIGRNHLNR
jgi:hypothetical protein